MFKFQYFSIVFPSIFIPTARRHKHQNPIQIQKSLLPVGDVTDFIKELSQPIFKGEVHLGTFVQIAYDVRTLSRKTGVQHFKLWSCIPLPWTETFLEVTFSPNQEPQYPTPPVPLPDSYNPPGSRQK